MIRRTRSLLTVAAIALSVVAGGPLGCANETKKPPVKKEMAVKWNNMRAGVMYGMAKQQFDAGDMDKCRDSLSQALKMHPEHLPSLLLAARLGLERNQLEEAQKSLDLARKVDPKNAEADYLSGVVYQRWQQPQKAYDYYTSAAEKAPSELAYLLARAEMLVALDKQQEALDLVVPKVQFYEHSAAIRDAAGQFYMHAGKYPQAVDYFRQASVLAGQDLTIREHLGLAQYYAGQYKEAIETLTKLTKEDKYTRRADLLVALGECQMQTGKVREARDSFESAAQIDPASAHTWLGLGKAALALNDTKRADLSLRKALTLDPASSETQLMLGYVRLRQDKMPDALTAFKKAATLNEKDPVALSMVGYVYEKLGSKDQAMEYYGKALKLKPNDELATKLMAGVGFSE